MRVFVTVVAVSLLACGASDSGQSGADSGPGSADGGALADGGCADCGQLADLTLFVFDQSNKQILRFEDGNRDGDMMDSKEVSVFFNNDAGLGIYNSQGMVALGSRTLLATDNLAGANNDDSNVIRLDDSNADGDAFDDGEASYWFTGVLPAGGALTFPVSLTAGPDGAVYLVQNEYYNTEQPDMVYRLEDLNGDDDVDDEGELSEFFDITSRGEPIPQVFDLDFAADGSSYAVDIRTPEENTASVDRISPDGSIMTEFIDAVGFFTLTQDTDKLVFPGNVESVAYDAVNDELIVSTIDLRSIKHLVALKDLDESGAIDQPGELRVIWDSEAGNAEGFLSIRDLHWIPDGSLLLTDSGAGQIFRLVDENQDGDFNDPGEAISLYDRDKAADAGLPVSGNLFTTAVWIDSTR